jgi:hypothetical protein
LHNNNPWFALTCNKFENGNKQFKIKLKLQALGAIKINGKYWLRKNGVLTDLEMSNSSIKIFLSEQKDNRISKKHIVRKCVNKFGIM